MITKTKIDDKKLITESFLSFNLGEEHFAIEVMKIMEILEIPKITKVPNAPNFLVGVVNLRGGVLPVIDTKIKFNMPAIEFSIDTCILVLNIKINGESVFVGALVDSVSKVFDIEEKNIQASPSIGARYKADFIRGMLKENDKFMMLLEIDRVFSPSDLEAIMDTKSETELRMN